MGRRASLLVEEKCLFSVSLVNGRKRSEKAELSFSHSHTLLLSTSISLSTMCALRSDPFVEPLYSLETASTRLHSPIPESVDATNINIARPKSALPILPSTIHAVDIAMPATSKILLILLLQSEHDYLLKHICR